MEQPSDAELNAKGFFRCLESNEIFCAVCPADTKLEAWAVHCEDPSHLVNMEQFDAIFKDTDGGVHCSLCNVYLDWPELKRHARSHMILPWHKPDDEYDRFKVFFDNRIFLWENLFQCCICDATFADWDVVFVHIADQRHQAHRDDSAATYEFPKETVTYEFLVSEGFVGFSKTKVECRICSCAKVDVHSIARHVNGLMHKTNKTKFHLDPNNVEAESIAELEYANSQFEGGSRSEDSSLAEPTLQAPTFKNSTLEHFEGENSKEDNREFVDQSAPCNYIMKHDRVDSHCVICNCIMPHYCAISHVREKEHLDAEKEYGCEKITLARGTDYYCSCCNSVLTGLANVYSHVLGNKHLKSLSKSRSQVFQTRAIGVGTAKPSGDKGSDVPETKKVQRTCTQTDGSGTLRRPHLNLYKEDENLADSSSTSRRLEVNLRESDVNSNVAPMEKYGFDGLLPDGDDQYYCSYCNCKISGCSNARSHAESKGHLVRSNRSQGFQTRPNSVGTVKLSGQEGSGVSETKKQQQIHQQPDSSVTLRRPHLNLYKKDEHPADSSSTFRRPDLDSRESKDVNSNVAAMEKHGLFFSDGFLPDGDDQYYCSYCNCKIFGCSNARSHAESKGHLVRSSRSQGFQTRPNSVGTVKLSGQEGSGVSETKKQQQIHQQPDSSVTLRRPHLNLYKKDEHPADSSSTFRRPDLDSRESKDVNSNVAAMEKHGLFFSDGFLPDGDDQYYCSYCNCKIFGCSNARSHAESKGHLVRSSRSQGFQTRPNGVGTVKPSGQEGSGVSETKKQQQIHQQPDSSVTLRRPQLNLYKKDEHPADSSSTSRKPESNLRVSKDVNSNVAAMEKHGLLSSNGLLPDGVDQYYCSCCNCKICGPANARSHAEGKKHLARLRNWSNRQNL